MKYFGTDGIRGKAYSELTLDLSYQLGLAINHFHKEVVIGIDTRYSSLDLAKAFISGLKQPYQFAGVVPTSAIMLYSYSHKVLGVMITASHNPYYDNGFKIINNGEKISADEQVILEMKIDENRNEKYLPIGNQLSLNKNIFNEYVLKLKKHVFNSKSKVLFDAANGCFSEILPLLIDEKDVINNKPNGLNINDNCGATNVSNLICEVKKRGYDLGVAFDGDGDRVIFVDKENNIYKGDFLIYILATKLKEKLLLKDNFVILSELTNPGILEGLKDENINYYLTPVGDTNITNRIKEGYVLGGEPSGHIINTLILPFGDGLINAFEILRLLEDKSIKEYLNQIKLFYHRQYNYQVKYPFRLHQEKTNKIIKKFSNSNASLKIRKSGTEKVIRIDYFTKDNNETNKTMERIIKGVKKCIKKNY